MKKNRKTSWILLGALVISLTIGKFAFANPQYNGYTPNRYDQGIGSKFNNGYGYMSGMMGGFNGRYRYMSSMMGSWNGVNQNINPSGKKNVYKSNKRNCRRIYNHIW